jgi:small conductance mechanosensitive channel
VADEKAKFRVGLVAVTLVLLGIFAIFTILLYALQRVLGIPIPYPEITITLTWAVLGLLGVWVLGRTIQTTTSQLIGRQNASTVRKILTFTLVLAILIATLSRLGIDLSGYLVSVGVTAIVIGFAAQATLGNLIAGVLVMVSRPFRKGDYIRVNITGAPIEGTIDEISFLRSRVMTNDGVSISIPNTVMLAVPISNFTISERRPIILNITLGRDASVDTLRTKVEATMRKDGIRKEETRLYVKSFDSDSITVELWVHVTTQNFLRERSLIIHSIQKTCQKEKIPLKRIELQS